MYGFELPGDARILAADGTGPDSWHYMDPDEHERFATACAAVRFDLSRMREGMDQNAPPRRGGLPCWEEVTRFPITPARRTKILEAMGLDGIRYLELALAVDGDLLRRDATWGEPFRGLRRAVLGDLFGRSPVSVAVFDPALLAAVGEPVDAALVAEAVLDGADPAELFGPAPPVPGFR